MWYGGTRIYFVTVQGGEANVTLYEKVGTPEDPQLSGMSVSKVFI